MAYRDDTDAALARADALQRELDAAEAERDRLRKQVEQLQHAPTTERDALRAQVEHLKQDDKTKERDWLRAELERANQRALVVTPEQPAPLTLREVESLIQGIEQGFQRTRRGQNLALVSCMVILLVSLPLYFLSWKLALCLTAVGALGSLANLWGLATSEPDAVLAAVRDRPQEVLTVMTSNTTLYIETRTQSARCTSPDSPELSAKLMRRCDNANR